MLILFEAGVHIIEMSLPFLFEKGVFQFGSSSADPWVGWVWLEGNLMALNTCAALREIMISAKTHTAIKVL